MEEEEPSVMEEVNAMGEEEDRGGDDVTAIAEAGIEQLSWLVCLIGTWRQDIANLVWVLFLTLFISYFFAYNWQYLLNVFHFTILGKSKNDIFKRL